MVCSVCVDVCWVSYLMKTLASRCLTSKKPVLSKALVYHICMPTLIIMSAQIIMTTPKIM